MGEVVFQKISSEELKKIESWLTPDRATEVLRSIADTPAPSQTPSLTRGGVVRRFLSEWGVLGKDSTTWSPNYRGTGNGVLSFGSKDRKTTWFLAHWDTISFLIGERSGTRYELTPFHEHMMVEGEQPGVVLGFSEQSGNYEEIARGTIIGGQPASFEPDREIELRPGCRVAYDTPSVDLGDYVFSGQFDNAAGCAAMLLAAGCLSSLAETNVFFCFTDEEEGPVATGNTAFSRGSQRLMAHFEAPDVAVVTDSHTVPDEEAEFRLGKGALIREYASRARGGVTPPWLYERARELFAQVRPQVSVNENMFGGLSRSDCISVMHKTPNVLLCGPPVTGRHYVNGVYRCSAVDVAHLARAFVVVALAGERGWFAL